jgi:hypothetical protein
MAYKSVAEAAAEIRAALKAKGWNSRVVSVRSESYSMGSSINIEIKSLAVSKAEVEEVANKQESIRYCEYSGEILSGGNRYVHVRYSHQAIEAAAAPWIPQFEALKNAEKPFLEIGNLHVQWESGDKFSISEFSPGPFPKAGRFVAPDVWGARATAESLVEYMAKKAHEKPAISNDNAEVNA